MATQGVPDSRILFLNGAGQTTIGQFGKEFVGALREASLKVDYFEAVECWKGFLSQLLLVIQARQTLIVNAGLTNWGRSAVRNFLGLLIIGLRGGLTGRTIVSLHTIIEIIDPKDAGYKVSPLLQWGAHSAVRLLRRCQIVVFSEVVGTLLKECYGIKVDFCTPIPCHILRTRPSVREAREPVIVFLGTLSLYKGLETLIQTAILLKGKASIKLIGPPHWILRDDPAYAAWLNSQMDLAHRVGIDTLGYVPERKLQEILAGALAGIMPYRSTNGASASFASFASSGLPVVATNLPEFQWLQGLGAGVLLVEREPEKFADAITQLIDDDRLREQLTEDQIEYSHMNDWRTIVGLFMKVAFPRPTREK